MKLQDKVYVLQSKLSQIETQLAQQQASREAERKSLQNAPQVRIDYVRTNETIETLEFVNDGPEDATNVTVGLVSMTYEYVLRVDHIPPIPKTQRKSARMYFYPETRNTVPLDSFLYTKTGVNLIASVRIGYQNNQGVAFQRDFALEVFEGGRLVWNAGPIRLRDTSAPPRET